MNMPRWIAKKRYEHYNEYQKAKVKELEKSNNEAKMRMNTGSKARVPRHR